MDRLIQHGQQHRVLYPPPRHILFHLLPRRHLLLHLLYLHQLLLLHMHLFIHSFMTRQHDNLKIKNNNQRFSRQLYHPLQLQHLTPMHLLLILPTQNLSSCLLFQPLPQFCQILHLPKKILTLSSNRRFSLMQTQIQHPTRKRKRKSRKRRRSSLHPPTYLLTQTFKDYLNLPNFKRY